MMSEQIYKLISDGMMLSIPALITGFFGYFSAKIQTKSKQEEINKNNNFTLKQNLIEFHKERITKNAEVTNSINALLGTMLGKEASSQSEALSTSDVDHKLIELHTLQCKSELHHTIKEFEYKNLEMSVDYSQLNNFYEIISNIESPKNRKMLLSNMHSLLEAYNYLAFSRQNLLEKEILELYGSSMHSNNKK